MKLSILNNTESVNIFYSPEHDLYSCVSDNYDGAPDSDFIIGWGKTAEAATEDYIALSKEVEDKKNNTNYYQRFVDIEHL